MTSRSDHDDRERVPAPAASVRRSRLVFDADATGRLTHHLFRFPAKFHPPVVRRLLADYTEEGERVLDPFCGSGTLLVEAAVAGRHAVGTDVDPLAVFVTGAKSKALDDSQLQAFFGEILGRVETHRRPADEYEARQWTDLTVSEYDKAIADLAVPAIPNLFHWFRKYVIVDLVRLRDAVTEARLPRAQKDFFLLLFAAILRSASNADPVPVSGLEVTSHMRERDAKGRVIDAFALWEAATKRAIRDMGTYREQARDVELSAFRADATTLRRRLRVPIDAVITSPPYHGAVDYYRRHQLEMYWLGLTQTHSDRLGILQQYIGRAKVAARHPLLQSSHPLPIREQLIDAEMRKSSARRADAFRHYCLAMAATFRQLGGLLAAGRPALFVVGHSTWKGAQLNTTDLFEELASPYFRLTEVLDYPVKNRYMSYARHNGANIDREYVLVMQRVDHVEAGG